MLWQILKVKIASGYSWTLFYDSMKQVVVVTFACYVRGIFFLLVCFLETVHSKHLRSTQTETNWLLRKRDSRNIFGINFAYKHRVRIYIQKQFHKKSERSDKNSPPQAKKFLFWVLRSILVSLRMEFMKHAIVITLI